jgi:ferredoxin
MATAAKSDEGSGANIRRRSWPHPIKASTRAFWREGRRTPGYSLFDALHGYVYARWPYLYIGTGVGEHPLHKLIDPLVRLVNLLFKPARPQASGYSVAGGYHGKVLPLEEATRLVMVNEPIAVRDLEQVIPYERARSIILHNPDHLVALDCPCRVSRPDPCLPLNVCLIVGEPFASFVLEHHPGRSTAISQQEAAAILAAEHERGHIHHAFFKDAMLDRFYAICNCCSCCCGAMQAFRHGTPMLASSGYVCRVDEMLCAGCGDCLETCRFGALSLPDGVAVVDEAACMGCGLCASRCLEGALELALAPSRGEPLLVETLLVGSGQPTA